MTHNPQFIIKSPVVALPASQVNPARWGGLDPGYITTPNASARFLFYGPENSSFSPTIFQLDELTKDAGSKWISAQIRFTYTAAVGYMGPVVELVGSLDKIHCLDEGAPCNQTKLQVSEASFWPDSKNFTMVRSYHISHIFVVSDSFFSSVMLGCSRGVWARCEFRVRGSAGIPDHDAIVRKLCPMSEL